MIVTKALYDVRESHNCAWTFETHFSCSSGPQAGATPENFSEKPLGMMGWETLYFSMDQWSIRG